MVPLNIRVSLPYHRAGCLTRREEVVSPVLPQLRRIRESKFLTQQDLAARSGVSRIAIARLERGTVSARFSTLRKLAEALDVQPKELVEPAI
jgi:predicted transcriptional regulator